MNRNAVVITIDIPGRDHGKRFRLIEASPFRVEEWTICTMLAMAKAGVEVPPDFATLGIVELITVSLRNFSGLDWPVAKGLLAEMLTCVEFAPDPRKPTEFRPFAEDDIDDVATLVQLRLGVVKLHMNMDAVPAAARMVAGSKAIRLKKGTAKFPL